MWRPYNLPFNRCDRSFCCRACVRTTPNNIGKWTRTKSYKIPLHAPPHNSTCTHSSSLRSFHSWSVKLWHVRSTSCALEGIALRDSLSRRKMVDPFFLHALHAYTLVVHWFDPLRVMRYRTDNSPIYEDYVVFRSSCCFLTSFFLTCACSDKRVEYDNICTT